MFSANGKVYRYFNYPVIFPNLLAAWNLVLVVETWLTDPVITTRLTALLPGKVNMPEKMFTSHYSNCYLKPLFQQNMYVLNKALQTCTNPIAISVNDTTYTGTRRMNRTRSVHWKSVPRLQEPRGWSISGFCVSVPSHTWSYTATTSSRHSNHSGLQNTHSVWLPQ